MSSKQAIELNKAYLLLNHGPVTLVTSAHDGRQNVMAASWAMPLDFLPARVAVVVNSGAYTRELIDASGEFAINIPSKAIASKIIAAGSQSGRDGDKFSKCEIDTMEAKEIGAPLVDGCVGWLECKVIPETHIQEEYDLILADVVAAWVDPQAFSNGRWDFKSDDRRTLHYMSNGSFQITGDTFEVK